jgi:endoglucanase
MRPRTTLAAAVAFMAGLLAGCGSPAETQLHPDLPAVAYAPLQHPLRGARLYLDIDSAASRWQAAHRAGWLDPITRTPQARWLNSPQDLTDIPRLVHRAERGSTTLVFVAYYTPDRGCTRHGEGAPDPAAYLAWIDMLITRLGHARAVIIMEPDAIPADCFDATRAAVLKAAVERLVDAGQYVYLDAGHSRWRSSGDTAERLLAAGINNAEGFTVNVSNRQTTKDAYRWGRELADLVGNREFIIDTSRNGLGPPSDDPNRDDEWCNPVRQALGPPPTTRPKRPGVAALLWIKRPGESDGRCGGETTYLFTPRQARNLIANTSWVDAVTRQAARPRRDPTHTQ